MIIRRLTLSFAVLIAAVVALPVGAAAQTTTPAGARPARKAPVSAGPTIDDDPGINSALRNLLSEARGSKVPKYKPPPRVFRVAQANFFYQWYQFRCATGPCPFHAIGMKLYPLGFVDLKGYWKLLRVGIGLAGSFERSQKRTEYWQHNIGMEALLSVGIQYPWWVTPYLEITIGLGALHRNIYNKDIFDFAWSFGLEIGMEVFAYKQFHLFFGLGYRRNMVDIGENRFFIDSFSASVGFGL